MKSSYIPGEARLVFHKILAGEGRLLVENAHLKRQLAEQAEELVIVEKAEAYFAKSLMRSTLLCKTIQWNSRLLP